MASETVDLTPSEVFVKCYAQLTGKPVKKNHPLYQSVVQGASPVDACMQLFEKAALDASGNLILGQDDEESVSILHHLNQLHLSEFQQALFQQNSFLTEAIGDFYDLSTPALFFTRALLTPTARYQDVLTLNHNLKALRKPIDATQPFDTLTGVWSGVLLSSIRQEYASAQPAGTPHPTLTIPSRRPGRLSGILPLEPSEQNASFKISNNTMIAPYSPEGAGFLSDPSFLMMNLGNHDKAMDGGFFTARRFTSRALKIILCNDLPLIRANDSATYIKPNSAWTFRNTQSCVDCHASMDGMAGALRNLRYVAAMQSPSAGENQAFHIYKKTPTLQTAVDVLNEGTPSFSNTSPQWILPYRNHLGNLITGQGQGFTELAQFLAQSDAFPICLAQRYTKYFLGWETFVGDEELRPQLNPQEKKLREDVIRMGTQLKATENLKGLIRAIFEHPHYRRAVYE